MSALDIEDTRGWYLYDRLAWHQQGPKLKTDYFIHSDRQKCEENVINYFFNNALKE